MKYLAVASVLLCLLIWSDVISTARVRLNTVWAQEDQETTQQAPTRSTDPEFVVIYNLRMRAEDPLVNLRVVIHAKSESDAIVRATLYLNKTMGSVIDMDKLQFVEAAPKRVDPPKDGKEQKK